MKSHQILKKKKQDNMSNKEIFLEKLVDGESVKVVKLKKRSDLNKEKSKLLKGEGFNCVVKMKEVAIEEE